MVNWYYVYCRSGFELLGSLSFPGSRTVILVTPCLARRQKELVAQLTVRADKLAGQHIQTGNIVDRGEASIEMTLVHCPLHRKKNILFTCGARAPGKVTVASPLIVDHNRVKVHFGSP